MANDATCINPVDMFISPPDMDVKTSLYTQLDTSMTGVHDEKFITYDSSPASTGSCTDDNTFSPIDHDTNFNSSGRPVLGLMKQLLGPYQDQLDPPAAVPIPLDGLRENLVWHYLTEYPETVYGFSSRLTAHPMAVLLALALRNAASFHLVLARAAQHQLSSGKNSPSKDLELVMMDHKAEAFQIILNFSNRVTHGRPSEDWMSAIIGLGLIDRFSGDNEAASMHTQAGRKLLKSLGGPLQIQSVWLSRVIAHFECGYSASTQSFIWDRSNFVDLHADLNRFFATMWSSQRDSSWTQPSAKRLSQETPRTRPLSSTFQEQDLPIGLKPDSVLHRLLSQKPEIATEPTSSDRYRSVFQLTCLFVLCTIVRDYRSDPAALQAYIDGIHDLISATQLEDHSVNNAMWMLQFHDQSEAHSRRVWDAAGWIWILKHVNFNVQGMVQDWLVAVLTGKPVSRALKLDSFAFSYAS